MESVHHVEGAFDGAANGIRLTPKQELFAREYLIDLNATQAAVRVGYSPKTAHAQGARLLTNVKVAAAVATQTRRRLDRLELTADGVLRELLRIARADIRQLFDAAGSLRSINDLPDDVAAAISSIEVVRRNLTSGDGVSDTIHKIRTWDKNRALETLAKHLGLLEERVHVATREPLVFVIEPAPKTKR